MKKWITKKLNIVLIAGGVLIISTVMLITGIYFAKTAEENKVIKTAYAADDAVKEEVLGTSDGNAAEEEANDTEQTDAPELTDDTVALSESAIESPAVEPPAPVATGTQEPGPENITADQAMDTMIEYTEKVYGEVIDKTSLSAMFDRVGYDVKHDIWGVSNSEYRCSINAISGELHILETKEEYSGADNITIIDFMELNDVIRDNPESYYEKARAMVEANLADGRNIEDMFIDGIQVVFTNGDQPQTIQVDCRVLMESGRSYSLSFTGSELYVTSFYSHPTQHAAVFGYWWEEEASEYPKDWHVPN